MGVLLSRGLGWQVTEKDGTAYQIECHSSLKPGSAHSIDSAALHSIDSAVCRGATRADAWRYCSALLGPALGATLDVWNRYRRCHAGIYLYRCCHADLHSLLSYSVIHRLLCVYLSNHMTARVAAQEVVAEAVPMLAVPDDSVDRFNTICAQISDAEYAGGGVEVH